MKRDMMKKIGIYSMIFCFSSFGLFAVGSLSGDNLKISKQLDFIIDIDSALVVDLEPVDLDFGDLVRGTNQTKVATGDLKFKAGFNNDVQISIDYDTTGDQMIGDPKYAMYKIKHEDVKGEKITENDTLDVYIQRVKDFTMTKGETKIPIVGEIRSVSKDAKLGKYSEKINATVFVTPVEPVAELPPVGRVKR